MEIVEILEKIGLNEKQARVYLSLLELGTASVQLIAQKANLKRPTTYLILEELQQKGIVSIVPRVKKALFVAESPEKLIADLKKKEDLLQSGLPSLLALYNARKEKPQVQLFEGREGIKLLYDKIYSSSEVWFFGTIKEAQKYNAEGIEQFIKRAQKEGLRVRDLLAGTPEDLAHAQKARLGPRYELRFISGDSKFLNDNALFGDNVVFFSFHPQIFAVLISSKEVSLAIRTLYEFAWQQAKALDPN
jgi:sugar-specific transcriptional regulator TrmB